MQIPRSIVGFGGGIMTGSLRSFEIVVWDSRKPGVNDVSIGNIAEVVNEASAIIVNDGSGIIKIVGTRTPNARSQPRERKSKTVFNR